MAIAPNGSWGQTNVPSATPAPLPSAAQEAMKKGINAAKQQEWEIAIRSFQEARKTAPDAPEVFYNLGLAESKVPGRELRAIAWFGAYLSATTNAPTASAVKDKIAELQIKNEGNTSRLIKQVEIAAGQISGHDRVAKNQDDLAVLWAKSGDITAALNTTKLIDDDIYQGSALSKIAEIQAEAGDIAGASKSADLITRADYKTEALLSIGKVQITTGDVAAAQKTLVSAKEIAAKITELRNGSPPDSEMSSIASAQAEAGDIGGAQKTAELIQDAEQKSRAWEKIAKAQTKAGDVVGAQKSVDLVPEGIGKSVGQLAVAEAQLKAGDIGGALKTAGVIRDAGLKQTTLKAIVVAQITSRDFAAALRSADLMAEGTDKGITQFDIVKAQSDAGDIAGALKAAETIQQALWKTFAQVSVARTQTKNGDVAGAKSTLAAAQRTANRIQGADDKASGQSSIAEVQAKAHSNNAPNSTHQSTSGTQPPIQPVIPVSVWLQKLDGGDMFYECRLNSEPFLDLAGYLKSLPPSDNPQEVFKSLYETAEKIVRAKNVITQMLKQQAGK